MKFELKKLKIARALSEETLAYTADIYIDGKLAFHAKNQGHGGCDMFYRAGDLTEEQVNAWIKANMPKKDYGDDLIVDPDLETVVGDLIARVEVTKKLDRLVKTKVVTINDQDVVWTFKAAPTPQNCDAVLAKNPGVVIVNNCSPEVRERVLVALGG